jgi:hypothetical protein
MCCKEDTKIYKHCIFDMNGGKPLDYDKYMLYHTMYPSTLAKK